MGGHVRHGDGSKPPPKRSRTSGGKSSRIKGRPKGGLPRNQPGRAQSSAGLAVAGGPAAAISGVPLSRNAKSPRPSSRSRCSSSSSVDSLDFLTSLSLSSAAGFAGPIGAIAVGEVLVLVLGEIDLSAGQVFLFTPWVMYWCGSSGSRSGAPSSLALLVACGVGAINGLITVLLERAVVRHDPGDELHPLRRRAHLVERHRGVADPGSLPPQTTTSSRTWASSAR